MAAGADAALAGMARAVHEVGRRLVEALGADGLSIYQSNGEAAGQELFHLHQHLVPRWHGDARLITSEVNTEEADRVDVTFAEISQS
jgi:histidine triad (HIT) family protein